MVDLSFSDDSRKFCKVTWILSLLDKSVLIFSMFFNAIEMELSRAVMLVRFSANASILGERGATMVAILDRGDLALHIPRVDGPSWNAVPLVHLHRGERPSTEDWALANAIVERMERYR